MTKYKCAFCGKEFETSAKDRKYCSHACYIADRFHKPLQEEKEAPTSEPSKPDEHNSTWTEEEEKAYRAKFNIQGDIVFGMTMQIFRKMFQEGLLSVKEYWTFFDKFKEKNHPDAVTAFLYSDPYDSSDPEQWKKYHDKVPVRLPNRKPEDLDEHDRLIPKDEAEFTEEQPADAKPSEEVSEPEEKTVLPNMAVSKPIEKESVVEGKPELENGSGGHFVADEIKKLKELLDCGALTQEEFDAQKKKLLNM